jgi:hypothetical protein
MGTCQRPVRAPCQSGSFVISTLAVTAAEVEQLTIAFACDESSAHGCVHLEHVPRRP